MTSPAARPNTALLIIDVQNNVVPADTYNRTPVLAAINTVLSAARASSTPVIWIQHNSKDLVADTPGWEFVPELDPRPTEPLVQKRYRDAFEDTTLAKTLQDLDVGHIVVTGAQTDMCVRSTLHGGFTRGYNVTLVEDAHTTEDMSEYEPGVPKPDGVVAHLNVYWDGQDAPGRTGRVVKAAEVVF